MAFRDPSEAKQQRGDRVYHAGQQFPGAEGGTATVLEVKPQHDGTFEYWVRRDRPAILGGSLETWWASYYTRAAVTLDGSA
jgi:hypothetical protein